MAFVANDLLLGGKVVESSAADNATATAAVAAQGSYPSGLGQRVFIAGYAARYSAAPAAGLHTLTFKAGTTTLFTVVWDFATFGNILPVTLPLPIHGDYGQAVSIELSASGTGGVTGIVTLFYGMV